MTIPFIYHQGDYIEADKENSNHQYLNDLTLKNHNHSIYGDGGQLENTVNSGTFTTDTLEVVSGLDLTTTLGYVEDGGYIFDSSRFNSGQWHSLSSTPTVIDFGTFSQLSGLYPQITQYHLANGTPNPPEYFQILHVDNTNRTNNWADFYGYGGIGGVKFTDTGNITTKTSLLYTSRNAGTLYSEISNPIYRVVVIFGGGGIGIV